MLAIIPARGGSKGLPRKNVKLLNGIPLIAHTILAAQKSKSISRIIVSTDDEEIAQIAKEYGAEIPFMRPAYLATDSALSLDVYEYTINKIEEDEKIKVETFIVLQPTSPLRLSIDISRAIELYQNKKAFSVISFCKEHHPINWHKYIGDEYKVKPIFEDKLQNRQEIFPTYFPNGAIYVLNKKIFQTRSYYSSETYAYIMERTKSIDIDNIEDFEYAEFLINRVSNEN